MNLGLRLWLVRHGQTDWNASGLCLGHTDIPLNQYGQDAVKKLRNYIDMNACDALYVSPLQRTIETANILVNHNGISQQRVNELREVDFGHWEGKTWEKIQRSCRREWLAWRQNPIYSAPHGGESLYEVANRAESFYNILKKEHEGQTVLIVSHGGFLNILLCTIFNVPLSILWNFRLNPASFSEVVIHSQGPMLTVLNQTPVKRLRNRPFLKYGHYEKIENFLQVI